MSHDLSSELAYAAELLRRGAVVVFPTETVYGLGANALDPVAVARIFEIKQRPFFDPLIVHLPDRDWLPQLCSSIPAAAVLLIERFWPGPLTIVLPKSPLVPDIVTSGSNTVAVRMPDHLVARELLRLANVPVAAPSANLFGRISPTTAAAVREQLGDDPDMILDGGPCRVGIESTVIQFDEQGVCHVLRHGGVPAEDLVDCLGSPISMQVVSISSDSQPLVSPGTTLHHYAPKTPLRIVEFGNGLSTTLITDSGSTTSAHPQITPPITTASGTPPVVKVGHLRFQSQHGSETAARTEVLSPSGDLREAAANLFAALRRLDSAGVSMIESELVPDIGLGRAINDRLRRAAAAPSAELRNSTDRSPGH